MILKRNDTATIGHVTYPAGNFTGLLGMVQRNEYTILPKIEAYHARLDAVDFTHSFWKKRYFGITTINMKLLPYYHFSLLYFTIDAA